VRMRVACFIAMLRAARRLERALVTRLQGHLTMSTGLEAGYGN